MKIYGNVFLNKVKQSDIDIFDFNVENSFTPKNLWHITFDEGIIPDKEIKYNSFSFHKIQNIIHGYICFNNIKFQISMIIYTNGSYLEKKIIECFCEKSNYTFKGFDLSEDLNEVLVDLDELKSLPEFENKSNIECFKKLMDEKFGVTEDIINYDSKFIFYKSTNSSKLYNSLDFLDYSCIDSV